MNPWVIQHNIGCTSSVFPGPVNVSVLSLHSATTKLISVLQVDESGVSLRVCWLHHPRPGRDGGREGWPSACRGQGRGGRQAGRRVVAGAGEGGRRGGPVPAVARDHLGSGPVFLNSWPTKQAHQSSTTRQPSHPTPAFFTMLQRGGWEAGKGIKGN